MNPTPKLHRFRFRLRTLFAVMTVIAIYLGWQASIVHERKALIAKGNNRDLWYVWGSPPSWSIRTLMGDRSYYTVAIRAEASATDLARVVEVFPEAEIADIPYRATGGPGNAELFD